MSRTTNASPCRPSTCPVPWIPSRGTNRTKNGRMGSAHSLQPFGLPTNSPMFKYKVVDLKE